MIEKEKEWEKEREEWKKERERERENNKERETQNKQEIASALKVFFFWSCSGFFISNSDHFQFSIFNFQISRKKKNHLDFKIAVNFLSFFSFFFLFYAISFFSMNYFSSS